MTDEQREAFNRRLDQAIDEASDILRPLFDTLEGGGVYHLPAADAELLHEIMFKLGMLRSVIVHGDVPARDAHAQWLHVRTLRGRHSGHLAQDASRHCAKPRPAT